MTDKGEATINQAFLHSCWKGNKEKVQACLTLEVNVNSIGKTRNKLSITTSSGLTKAAINGHIDVVDLLLTATGIDINKTNENGLSALHKICWISVDRSEIITKLCSDPRIKLNKKDTWGRTPAFLACSSLTKNNIIALKNVPGVNWNIKEDEGDSPLMFVVKKGKTDKVAELVKIPGIDLNTTNKRGETLEKFAR